MAASNLPKVSIIGSGNVGSTCAFLLAAHSLADIYLFDKLENLGKAKALDIGQAAVALGSESKVVSAESMESLAGSQVIVITAGVPRKPGMSRQDLIATNSAIVSEIALNIKEQAPNAVVIVVSNPLDILTWLVLKKTGFDRRRVFGMAGLADNARLKYFAAQKANVSPKKIESHVLGQHGDHMVIPDEKGQIDGRPFFDVLGKEGVETVKESARKAGAQIVELLNNGSAYFLPGAGAFLMAKAVINDAAELFDTCVYLEEEYGLSGVCLGVPAVIGKKGVIEIKDVGLSPQSLEELKENGRIFEQQLRKL